MSFEVAARAKLQSLPVYCSEFGSIDFPFDDLPPEFVAKIDAVLDSKGFQRGQLPFGFGGRKTAYNDVSIDTGFYQLQWHDYSVEDHTDELIRGHYFAIIPYECTIITQSTRFGSLPALQYYAPNGKRFTHTLGHYVSEDDSGIEVERSLIIFNPSRPHKLDLYGRSIKLMMFTVSKTKNYPNGTN